MPALTCCATAFFTRRSGSDSRKLRKSLRDTIVISTNVQITAAGESGRSALFNSTVDGRLTPGTIIGLRPLTPSGKAEAARATAKSWPIELKEDFNGNADGWPTGAMQRRYGHEEASLTGGRYQLAVIPSSADEGETEYETAKPVSVTSFYAEVDVRKIAESQFGNCGLAFRWFKGDDEDDYFYFFRIHDDKYSLAAFLPQTGWQPIISSKFSAHIHPGQMNSIAVLANGNHFTLFINGKYVDEVINTAIERGDVRLAAQTVDSVEKITCEFDNFELRVPPSQ